MRLFLDDANAGFTAGWTMWRKPDLFEGVALDVGGPEYTRQDEQFLKAAAARRSGRVRRGERAARAARHRSRL